MNTRKRAPIIIVIVLALLLAFGCGYAADAFDKQVYPTTPTPPADGWGDRIEVDYKQCFWIKDGDQAVRSSLAGLIPLLNTPTTTMECTITHETFGASYHLTCTETEAGTFVVIAGEGLKLSE